MHGYDLILTLTGGLAAAVLLGYVTERLGLSPIAGYLLAKMFTAVATLTLAQNGKLALDAPLGKYLTDYPNKAVASNVTIHHLLTHTGGTGDIFGPQFNASRKTLRTHRDYLDLFGARGPLFDPGSQWMYSNHGFVLLGAVIEAVSGQSYYDYVREHVYAPG